MKAGRFRNGMYQRAASGVGRVGARRFRSQLASAICVFDFFFEFRETMIECYGAWFCMRAEV